MNTAWVRCTLAMTVMFTVPTSVLVAAGWRNDGTGRFPGAKPPLNWSKDKDVLWKVELLGKSLASPIVVGKSVFVTSDPAELLCLAAEDGKTLWRASHEYADVFDAAKAQTIEANLKQAEGIRKQKDDLNQQREEAKKTGDTATEEQLAAQHEVLDKQYRELTVYPPKPGGDTGNSTSTPVCDGKNVFAVFATGMVSSHTLTGKRNWITYIEGAGGDHSASPLLVDDKLIVHLRDLVALNPADGSVVWRAKSDELHGSPVATKVGEQYVLVTAAGDVIRTSDGVTIAKQQFRLGRNSPIIEDGVIYSLENGAIKALALPPAAKEEIKLAVKWEAENTRANQLASPVLHEGLLYSVGENGILVVTDAKSGEQVYRQRLELGGGRVDASLCLAGGALFVSSTQGATLVLKPGREFEQLARNENEGFSSSLAFANERIYVRTPQHLICLGK